MRAGRASGKVRRSGRGYVTVSGGSAPKRAAPRPSMRSGRGTIKRSSAGHTKKLLEKEQVLDQEEATLDDRVDIFIKINTS
jgi:hypothetical protein